MSLTPPEPIQSVLHSNLRTTSKHASETYQTWKVLYANQPVLTKSYVELEENSKWMSDLHQNDNDIPALVTLSSPWVQKASLNVCLLHFRQP
jgi:hypothetical protein